MPEQEKNAEHFLNLIRKSRKGKFKIYIGMSAGVGKTYRMLQEAQTLLRNGVDVKIGYIETHKRKETHDLLEGLPVIPRRKLFYKGKELDEFDVQAVINLRPEVVIVDELAHTNIEGSKNEKRWQDVMDILDAGINVISAVNIQHIESLYQDVKKITGIDVTEFLITIDNYSIIHTLERHGNPIKEAKRGQIGIQKHHFMEILDVILNPDTVRYDIRHNRTSLIFEKDKGDTYFIVKEIRQVVKSRKKNRLVLQSFYIVKKNALT